MMLTLCTVAYAGTHRNYFALAAFIALIAMWLPIAIIAAKHRK